MLDVPTTELRCAVSRCCALAIHGDRCAVHRDFDRLAHSVNCCGCGKPIKAGQWHRRNGDERRHFPACLKAKR